MKESDYDSVKQWSLSTLMSILYLGICAGIWLLLDYIDPSIESIAITIVIVFFTALTIWFRYTLFNK